MFATFFPEFVVCWFVSARVDEDILSGEFPQPSFGCFALGDGGGVLLIITFTILFFLLVWISSGSGSITV